MLEGLAQSLIARAVTLTDSRAAGKDRLRARDLLLSAKELGDQSQLSQNLLDVLKPLSASGEIKYADNGAVDAAMSPAKRRSPGMNLTKLSRTIRTRSNSIPSPIMLRFSLAILILQRRDFQRPANGTIAPRKSTPISKPPIAITRTC